MEDWREWISTERQRQLMTVEELEHKSGVSADTIRNWNRHSPTSALLETVLNALGYTLEPVRITPKKAAEAVKVPPEPREMTELDARLEELAEKLRGKTRKEGGSS